MTKLLVAADGVSKAYGSQRVLDGARFHVAEGERVALVGGNGSGKTTVLNMIAGRLRPDTGRLEVAPDLRFGYMTQTFEFAPDATVGSLLTQKPPQVEQLEQRLRAIEARMADPAFYEEPGYEDVLTEYGELQREVAELSTKGDAGAALPVLQELGMPDVGLERPMADLSGGQKTRVLLAKALANLDEMDLLLLDEPTNHLDIETVEWLEERLAAYRGALVLVAHDRYLMDALATKVLEVERHRVTTWTGNYSDYREQKAAYLKALEAKRKRQRDEVRRQLQIIEEIKRRNRFDSQAKSKETRLQKARAEGQVDDGALKKKSFRLQLEATHKSSNDVLEMKGVTKAFGDDAPILEGVNLTLRKGDRVGLIGPNGSGKTTLLRMIVGAAAKQNAVLRAKGGAEAAERDSAALVASGAVEAPTSGVIDLSPGVKVGFFDQEHAGLDHGRTLIEEVRSVRPKIPDGEARGLLGRFLFKGDDAFKRVEVLSGGEKARLSLLKFLLGETNLLVLDEPTNHLDLEGQEVIEQALAEYPGTLVVVSHDRHFLDAVVNKVAVIAHGRVGLFPGSFSEARTLDDMRRFMGEGEAREYVVRKSFKDYSQGKRYAFGDTVKVTGNETQTTKRLLRLAVQQGWLREK